MTLTSRLGPLVEERPVHLVLVKDTRRTLKRGHPWVYQDNLKTLPSARPGSLALLKYKDGEILAKGFYDPKSKLAFRVLSLRERLDNELLATRLSQAVTLRQHLLQSTLTTGHRLVNGEGDGLPGLVCDLYDKTAVLKLDGDGPEGFYNIEGVAGWLQDNVGVERVWLKYRSRGQGGQAKGKAVLGNPPAGPVAFLENGVKFVADVEEGQKTGFFFDQRDNRQRVRQWAANRRVLNLFGYTGGFSVYAGMGGAQHVTTVDIAAPALTDAKKNWAMNSLDPGRHDTVAQDSFLFLEEAISRGVMWDLVVVDPPSFAPSKDALQRALPSYERVFSLAAQVTRAGGLLAPSSCSSHVDPEMFCDIILNALSKARRRGTMLGLYGQPEDHPYPVACPELRYLKFGLVRLD